MRAESERQLRGTKQRTEALIKSMEKAQARIEPCSRRCAIACSSSSTTSTPRRSGALTKELTTVQGDVDLLVADLQQSSQRGRRLPQGHGEGAAGGSSKRGFGLWTLGYGPCLALGQSGPRSDTACSKAEVQSLAFSVVVLRRAQPSALAACPPAVPDRGSGSAGAADKSSRTRRGTRGEGAAPRSSRSCTRGSACRRSRVSSCDRTRFGISGAGFRATAIALRLDFGYGPRAALGPKLTSPRARRRRRRGLLPRDRPVPNPDQRLLQRLARDRVHERAMNGRRRVGMSRLRLIDSHSTTTPPGTPGSANTS